MDILRKLADKSLADKNISEEYFIKKLEGARATDFSDEKFRNPSGSGRGYIRRTIEESIGLA